MAELPANLEELRRRVRDGFVPELVFFWGHEPKKRGVLGRECLSQWYPRGFALDGRKFATAEHYMMWSKAELFGDEASARAILRTESPAVAKRLGRGVKGFAQELWNAHRFDIVLRASIAKFSEHDDLRAVLFATGGAILVEASPRDRIWGIGLGASNPRARDPLAWRGLNLLGFALTRARGALRGA
jgi:ribA/ribD-fused uncharacterized protein